MSGIIFRFLAKSLCLSLLSLFLVISVYSQHDYVLVIHGGAGNIRQEGMSDEQAELYNLHLRRAIMIGDSMLLAGEAAIDVVEHVVRYLEDCPLFNAGRGGVLANSGRVLLDASIMDGYNLRAGAVAGTGIARNPVSVARRIMDSTEYVLLVSPGVDDFILKYNLDTASYEYFITDERLEQFKIQCDGKHGTVGAVALDKSGRLAAATSTGGRMCKDYGRVGDSPIIGAGTYANMFCAVSATGHGEYFIRSAVAYDVSARMKYKGQTVNEAAYDIIQDELVRLGGSGGIIAIDNKGNIAVEFNTAGMFRAYVTEGGEIVVEMFR